jgi:hypothetical protein
VVPVDTLWKPGQGEKCRLLQVVVQIVVQIVAQSKLRNCEGSNLATDEEECELT